MAALPSLRVQICERGRGLIVPGITAEVVDSIAKAKAGGC